MKKTLSVLLSLMLVVQMVCGLLPVALAEQTILASYEDSFDYDIFGSIYDEKAETAGSAPNVTSLPESWRKESSGNEPKVEDGVLKLAYSDKNEGAVLYWDELPGFDFDATKTYTLTFDVKATDFGTKTGTTTRELYFAPDGYYNMIEFRSDKGIRVGNVSGGSTENWVAASAYTLGTTYNCTVVWTPATKTMTATVKNGSTVVGSGSRVIDDFATFNSRTDCFVLRCEDGASEVSNFTFSDGTKTYTQFETGITPLPTGWVKEASVEAAPNAPIVKNGILKFVDGDGVRMKWEELGYTFDAAKTYTLTFDVKITNFGENPSSDYRRELYFAPDGWFNMIELKHDKLRAGDTYQEDISKYKLNTPYSCTVVWEPANSKMTATVKDGSTTVVSGYRTKTEFASLNNRTKNFSFRCEDGAMEISNLTFTDGTKNYSQFNGSSSEEPPFPVSEFVWENEVNVSTDIDFGNYNGNKPKVEDGVAKLVTGDSLRLNWPSLAGFKFDSTKTYTLTFDVEVTKFGDTSISGNMNREFFFAPGGWYNQFEFRSPVPAGSSYKAGIRAGNSGGSESWNLNADAYKLNTPYTCTVVWSPSEQKITSTVKNGSTVVVTGSRTSGDYATLNKYTRSFVFRCENGAIELDNVKFTDGTNTYTQDFYGNSMTGGGYWSKERQLYSTIALIPQLKGDGVLTLDDDMGVLFNWKNVTNATPFSASKTYTFEFDAELSKGDGDNGCSGHSRVLYIGFGGWYNLLEMRTEEDENATVFINGNDSQKAAWSDSFKNIHVKIAWEGSTATTTLTDKNGNVLLSGSRTHTSFTDMADKHMDSLGIRCEDGKAVIDNFKFTVTDKALVGSKTVTIPSDKQAYYECDVACSNANDVRITLSDNEVFAYNNGALTLGAKGIKGTFKPGIYNFRMWINPIQNMVTTEITSPDGERVSRAIYTLSDAFTNGDDIKVFSDASNPLLSEKLEYLTVKANSYTVSNTEPSYSGYEVNVHNVVTSFIEDAATDRAFAWTAMASYIGTSDMAVRVRAKGASTWQEVTATKVQNDHVAAEEYFKADIYGLTADTEYEYIIGKKGGGSSDWSKTYIFKTAPAEIDEFTFVAVGDTQGEGWTGRGFQYAKAALDEAFEENSDAAFMLHAGDIVETGTNIGMWNTYFKALGEYGTKYPHFATMGNHITYGGDNSGIDNWNNHFNHPNNGGNAAIDTSKTAGLSSSALKYIANGHAEETIYSFNYGDAHFIVLNTGAYGAEDNILLEGQREWLEKDLEANKDAKWTIMLHHETVYHRNGGGEDHRQLANLVESSGVDLVIQGHSHLVTRTYPMMNQKIVTKKYDEVIPKGTGTVYMTIGSTTTNHDGVGDSSNVEEMFKIAIPMSQSSTTRSMPAYTTVRINDDELTLTIKQADGLILDQFTIKSPECQHVPGAWHTVIQPTTTATGLQELNCTLCGELLDSLEIPKLVEIPKTGDETNLLLLTTALIISTGAVAVLTRQGKKKRI